MRILLTANGSPWTRNIGGGTLAVHHLATALSKRGHTVTVLYGRRPGDPHGPSLPYNVEWAHFFEFATVNFNIFSFRKKLKRLLLSNQFDLIHGNAEEAYFAPELCLTAGIPFFYTSHANFLPSEGITKGILNPIRFLKSVNTYLERETAQKADSIFTFSEFSKSLVKKALGSSLKGGVNVVAPGIEEDWFVQDRENPKISRILFWGRMADQKGIPELLEAFKEVLKEKPEVRLLLVGGGGRQGDYESLSQNLGIENCVTFSGWKEGEEIRELAAQSLIGVFPSRVESFGLAIAEAMATGLPVISTRVGALPEFITDGETGILANPGNIDDLSDKMKFALNNPDKMELMGREAKKRIRDKCSWDRAAEAIESEYGRFLKK